MSKITHSMLSSYDPLFRILDAEEKGEQMNKSVANTIYLDIRRNELNKHTKESPNLVLAMNVIQIIVFLL